MLSQGRLSELIGSEGVPLDIYIRTLGITRAAEENYKNISEDDRAAL